MQNRIESAGIFGFPENLKQAATSNTGPEPVLNARRATRPREACAWRAHALRRRTKARRQTHNKRCFSAFRGHPVRTRMQHSKALVHAPARRWREDRALPDPGSCSVRDRNGT
jgi:hypothetical protein